MQNMDNKLIIMAQNDVLVELAKLFNVSPAQIIREGKDTRICDIRHIYCKLRHEMHGVSFTEIANEIGRTHAGVSYAIARINGLLGIDDIKISNMWNSAKKINGAFI